MDIGLLESLRKFCILVGTVPAHATDGDDEEDDMSNKKPKAYALNLITLGDLVDELEKEEVIVGRKLTNQEFNDLVNRLAREGKAEVLSVHKEKPDLDLLTGNLREDGKKVLNLNEEMRKNQNG